MGPRPAYKLATKMAQKRGKPTAATDIAGVTGGLELRTKSIAKPNAAMRQLAKEEADAAPKKRFRIKKIMIGKKVLSHKH